MLHTRPLRRPLPLLALALCLAAPAVSEVLVVDADGVGHTEIQQAIDAASDGDTIVVRAGSYSPFTVSGLERLHIVGATWNEPRDLGARACGAGVAPGTFDPVPVVDGSASPPGTHCVVIASAVSFSMTGLQLRACPLYGVSIVNSFDVAVVGNRIQGAGGAGVRVVSSADTEIACNLIGFGDAQGILLDDSTSALVADNSIGFNAAEGIRTVSGTGHDNSLVNNGIRGNELDCIVASGDGTRIDRNSCEDNTGEQEILIDGLGTNTVIVGNHCFGGSIWDLGSNTQVFENACP